MGAPTRTEMRRARRASIGAAFSYWSAHFVAASTLAVPSEIIEELEITAMLERAAYDELQRRVTTS
jgi:hypothetical protein